MRVAGTFVESKNRSAVVNLKMNEDPPKPRTIEVPVALTPKDLAELLQISLKSALALVVVGA